jgi:hypothetical protein
VYSFILRSRGHEDIPSKLEKKKKMSKASFKPNPPSASLTNVSKPINPALGSGLFEGGLNIDATTSSSLAGPSTWQVHPAEYSWKGIDGNNRSKKKRKRKVEEEDTRREIAHRLTYFHFCHHLMG